MIKLKTTCPKCGKTWNTTQMVLTKIKKGLSTPLCSVCKIKEDKTKLLPCTCIGCGETMMQKIYYIRHMKMKRSDVTGLCPKCFEIRQKNRVYQRKLYNGKKTININGCVLKKTTRSSRGVRCEKINICKHRRSCIDTVAIQTEWGGFTSDCNGFVMEENARKSGVVSVLNPGYGAVCNRNI